MGERHRGAFEIYRDAMMRCAARIDHLQWLCNVAGPPRQQEMVAPTRVAAFYAGIAPLALQFDPAHPIILDDIRCGFGIQRRRTDHDLAIRF